MRSLAWLAWVVALGGCSSLPEARGENRCAADVDCAVGSCDLTRGMCVATPPEGIRVGIEVVPASDPRGGLPLTVGFEPFDLTRPDERFELPPGSPIRGTVRHLLEPVGASLTFRAPSAIPGGPRRRVDVQTFTEIQTSGEETFNYATQLLPERQYEVSIEPNGPWRERLPPVWGSLRSGGEGGVAFNYDYPEVLQEVRGTIVDSSGTGQAGMIVRAIDPTSGRVVSSTYTTGTYADHPAGYFVLYLLPGTQGWVFSVNSGATRIQEGRPIPTFLVDPLGLLDVGSGVTLLLPSIAHDVITYGGSVEPAGAPGVRVPATVTFTSSDVVDDETGVVGTFRAMVATTDDPSADAAFTVQLLPGTYDVVVTPSDSTYGVLRETVVLGRERSEVFGKVFEVPTRARCGGLVQTADATPMLDAHVRAQTRGSTYDGMLDPVAYHARSSETVTDPDGRFNLPLDIGHYDVFVEPPISTNWPWGVHRDLPIGASDVAVPCDIELTTPVPLTATAVFADGWPVAGGEVRAFAVIDEPDGSSRALPIGRAQTDAEGRFTLLLPSSL